MHVRQKLAKQRALRRSQKGGSRLSMVGLGGIALGVSETFPDEALA